MRENFWSQCGFLYGHLDVWLRLIGNLCICMTLWGHFKLWLRLLGPYACVIVFEANLRSNVGFYVQVVHLWQFPRPLWGLMWAFMPWLSCVRVTKAALSLMWAWMPNWPCVEILNVNVVNYLIVKRSNGFTKQIQLCLNLRLVFLIWTMKCNPCSCSRPPLGKGSTTTTHSQLCILQIFLKGACGIHRS